MNSIIDTIAKLILFLFVLAIVNYFIPYDDTDDKINKERSGLQLYIDYGTGCQYIKGSFFAELTPRLDKDGNHICKESTNGGS